MQASLRTLYRPFPSLVFEDEDLGENCRLVVPSLWARGPEGAVVAIGRVLEGEPEGGEAGVVADRQSREIEYSTISICFAYPPARWRHRDEPARLPGGLEPNR